MEVSELRVGGQGLTFDHAQKCPKKALHGPLIIVYLYTQNFKTE